MKAVVKIVYSEKKLKLSTEEGYKYLELEEGQKLEYKLSDTRRCIGFHSGKGEMNPCPEFREIESGDQCRECRQKDIYSGWRQGSSTPDFEAEYSVYLAQCGTQVKVGTTRSERLEKRWKEQGADYASEIESGLTAEEALEMERNIAAENGISERISKSGKLQEAPKTLLEKKLLEISQNSEIVKVSENPSCSEVRRKGILPSPIKGVKGQIIYNSRYGMAMGSGRVLEKPSQRGLTDF